MNQRSRDLPPKTSWVKVCEYLERRWKLSERWEARHPLLFGAGTLFFVWKGGIANADYESILRNVVPTAVSVAAILAGFQGTIHTILLSLRDTRVIRSLKTTGHYENLVSFVGTGVISLLLFVAVALAALACDAAKLNPVSHIPDRLLAATTQAVSAARLPPRPAPFMAAFLAGLFVYAMVASVRIIRLIVKILEIDDGA